MESVPAVLTLKSSGADSSVLTAGVPQGCDGNGGSDARKGMWLCWRRDSAYRYLPIFVLTPRTNKWYIQIFGSRLKCVLGP